MKYKDNSLYDYTMHCEQYPNWLAILTSFSSTFFPLEQSCAGVIQVFCKELNCIKRIFPQDYTEKEMYILVKIIRNENILRLK